jgi:hypothetical protein
VSLRDIAVADHAAIIADTSLFAQPITVTNPAGLTAVVAGQANDVGEIIDQSTGAVMLGRTVLVQLLPQAIATAGLGEVTVVSDPELKPWLVSFADAYGVVRTFKIVHIMDEAKLGSLKCLVEGYRPSP